MVYAQTVKKGSIEPKKLIEPAGHLMREVH